MPRVARVPKYSHHKASGQARVVIAGKHVYLGRFGSEESRTAYVRIIAETATGGGMVERVPNAVSPDKYPDISINELLVEAVRHAERYYVQDGVPTGEAANIKGALVAVRALYGTARARDFGPRALKACQQYMITEEGLARTTINARVRKIKLVFKWAVEWERIPPDVYMALQSVPGLRRGRTEARETPRVHPVSDDDVEITLRFTSPHVADMIRLQRLTGMRPQDVCNLRACDLDMSEEVWVYRPSRHKTKYRESERLIPIGPRARAIILRYLDRDPEAWMFSPADVIAWHRTHNRRVLKRRTPVYPCELRRLAREKQARGRRRSRRQARSQYTTITYRTAILYATRKANKAGHNLPEWSPNQLRHARATELRRHHGIEAAQVVLGHARADVTQVYAEKNMQLAMQMAQQTG